MPKSKHIVKTSPKVTREDKEKLLGQKGMVCWMSGLSGSGKSTIAHEVEAKLLEQGRLVVVLDGDNLRHGLNSDLGFSDEDRAENLRRAAEVAKLFAENGIIVITSFISPTEKSRKRARDIISENVPFYEVFIKCEIEECKKRDPKGLYDKVEKGEITSFSGVDSVFEPPKEADLVIDTKGSLVKESADELLQFISGHIGI